jgi:hypothetical protein
MWSPRAIAVTTSQEREKMTALFNALFRAADSLTIKQLNHSVLPLNLPGADSRRYVITAARRGRVWEADAKIQRPDLDITFGT